jgi:glucosamine-6-phosphate deaminase
VNSKHEIIEHLKVGSIRLHVHSNRAAAGAAAGRAAAAALSELAGRNDSVGVIFATGTSQIDTLEMLTATKDLPWNQVQGFHLDEYVGIDSNHPASFRRYLRQNLTQKVKMKEFVEVDGSARDSDEVCRDYAERLRSSNPQLCLLGIGENGHLAFNDPEVANFQDPLDVKVVHLDTVCREQQAAEGWFQNAQSVPERAITVTIPTIFRVPKLIVSVPGIRKAKIIKRALEEPISTKCPASILRTHPDVTIYLDRDSAADLDRTTLFSLG